MLDLEFSAEQDMLRETVRKVCATHSPLSVVRELEDDPVGYATDLWKQMAELDLIGLLLPEEHGGSEMSALEGVVLYEELGRALAPTPHFASAVLCGGALARSGSAEQQDQWLGPIATGEAIVTPAWFEPENSCGPTGIHDAGRARRERATASPGPSATSPSRPRPTPSWCWPAPETRWTTSTSSWWTRPRTGCRLHQQLTVASDTQFQVTFDAVRVGPRTPASAHPDRGGEPGTL